MDVVKFVVLVLVLRHNDSINGYGRLPERKKAYIYNYPFLGVLIISERNVEPVMCTASLVTYESAITSGQCLVVNTPTKDNSPMSLIKYDIHLVMGVTDYTDTRNPLYQKSTVVKLLYHEKIHLLSEVDPFPNRYDIGAVVVHPQMKSRAVVGTIPLMPERVDPAAIYRDIIDKHVTCVVIGWKATAITKKMKKGPFQVPSEIIAPNVLLSTGVTIMGKQICCELYYNTTRWHNDYQYCMDTLGLNSSLHCIEPQDFDLNLDFDDAGSPVICPHKGRIYLAGIVTYGWTTKPHAHAQPLHKALMVMESVVREYAEMILINGGSVRAEIGRMLKILALVRLLC